MLNLLESKVMLERHADLVEQFVPRPLRQESRGG